MTTVLSPAPASAPTVPWGPGRLGRDGWRRVLVYGLGLSGRAAAELLLAHGVEVLAVDDKPLASLDLGDLGPRLLPHAGSDLPRDLDGVVVSPGVPPGRPLLAAAAAAGLPVVGEIELAFPSVDGPLAAITGSNGKSTTTALTGAMLAAAGQHVEVCGNIGQPLAAVVARPGSALPPGRSFVVELSSFQLETIVTLAPRAAALLNLAPDHLDRYSGLAAYGAAKQRIFELQRASDVAVLNADDPWVASRTVIARRRCFSRLGPVADGCHLADGKVVEVRPGAPDRLLFAAAELPLTGVHNLENAMAAALLALALGAGPEAIRKALATFRGLPHRLEEVARLGGVVWYDDSKGTNPAATIKSLEGFADGSVHLILGGRNKGADPADLAEMVGRKARWLYFIGEAASEMADALGHLAPSDHCGTLERAVAAAGRTARAGEVVVLSPACASFDQFKSYVDRGQQFQAMVRDWVARQDGGGDG